MTPYIVRPSTLCELSDFICVFRSVVRFLLPDIVCDFSLFPTLIAFFFYFTDPVCVYVLLRPICLCIFLFSDPICNYYFSDPVSVFLSDLFVYFIMFSDPFVRYFISDPVCVFVFILYFSASVLIRLIFSSIACCCPAAVSAPFPHRPSASLDPAVVFCRSACLSVLFDSILFYFCSV